MSDDDDARHLNFLRTQAYYGKVEKDSLILWTLSDAWFSPDLRITRRQELTGEVVQYGDCDCSLHLEGCDGRTYTCTRCRCRVPRCFRVDARQSTFCDACAASAL